MSYTFYIRDVKTDRELYWGNYTSNVYHILNEAFKTIKVAFPYYISQSWNHWSDGLMYSDRPPTYLATLLFELDRHKERYKEFEPSNGWGSFDGIFNFLNGILGRLQEYEEKNILYEVSVEW